MGGGGGVEGGRERGGRELTRPASQKNHAIQLAANPLCWTFYL